VKDTLGWILVNKGLLEEGTSLLRDAASIDNGRPQIRYHLAVALSKAGSLDDARNELQQLLATDVEFESRSDAEQLLRQLN
jgi:Flp pilus assembly protein TadD